MSSPGARGAAVTSGRRWWRLVRRIAGGVLALAVLLVVATPLGRYVARAAWEEGKILARRRPIAAILAEGAAAAGGGEGGAAVGTAVPASPASRELQRRLQLVVDARAFAQRSLALAGGESFTTYSALERDTLVLVLSAARRDTLAPYTWWFPVVGRFPYKGFFDFAEAERTAESMRRRGFDTWLRPASAFSTLGWFNDPLLSTTLRLDTLDLANTVIHELTHNTLFVKGKVTFNESFASFVGARGAMEFFRARGQGAAVRRLEAEWRDEKLLGSFWGATLAAVDSAYTAHAGDSTARVAARDSVFARMRRVLTRDLAPRLTTIDTSRLARLPLDNASLLARRVYAADLWLFDAVHARAGGSVKETVALVRQLTRGGKGDPFEQLRSWLAEHAPLP
ncbi:MAG: aminopeptidase [Gemmatimonadaceae bacterium]|nr:aminopeptidase [Gemmatimonadaceae bacterium]